MDESAFCQRLAVDSMNAGRGQTQSESLSKVFGLKGLPSIVRAHRGRLEGVLRESLDIRWGHVLGSISSSGFEHVMKFKKEEETQSSFLVDTSGVHSSIRKSLLPES
jgi:hypothetical protein